MLLDKSLTVAILISTLFHSVILLPLHSFRKLPLKKTASELRIIYVLPKEALTKTTIEKRPKTELVHQQIKKEPAPETKAQKAITAKPVKQLAKIEIPPELPKEKEALYLDYYQAIREKIRRRVLSNYPRFIACGEVCLYFILSPNGQLKEIKLIEERSSPNRLLKEIAQKSIQESTPFSPFPKGLNQAQLSFNVIISFELEN